MRDDCIVLTNTTTRQSHRPDFAPDVQLTMSTCWSPSFSKIWLEPPLSCLSLSTFAYDDATKSHDAKTLRHSQNRKYHRDTAEERPSQGHRQHAYKIWWSLAVLFASCASGQTGEQTNRHPHQNILGEQKEQEQEQEEERRELSTEPLSVCDAAKKWTAIGPVSK